jgi:IS30 family transposase
MDLRSGKKNTQHNYYNPKYVGSFSGLTSFNLPKVSKRKTENYLTSQKTYSLFKPVIRKFKRRKILCRLKYNMLEIDLIDMVMLSRHNKGVRYLLSVVDCYSRFAFVRLLKNKKALPVMKALASILDYTKNNTKFISADQGREFFNKHMSNFLAKKKLHYIIRKINL